MERVLGTVWEIESIKSNKDNLIGHYVTLHIPATEDTGSLVDWFDTEEVVAVVCAAALKDEETP